MGTWAEDERRQRLWLESRGALVRSLRGVFEAPCVDFAAFFGGFGEEKPLLEAGRSWKVG